MVFCVLVLAAVLAAVIPFGPVHRWRLQRSAHDEAGLAFPGSTLTHANWQDEEHARYTDTGGYDTPAGWSREYDQPPFAVGDLLAFYGARVLGRFRSASPDRGGRIERRGDQPHAER